MNINVQKLHFYASYVALFYLAFLFIFQRHIVIFLFVVYTVYSC